MIFGTVAMAFRGTSLKIHWLQSPPRILCSQVFFTPLQLTNYLSPEQSDSGDTSSMNSVSLSFSLCVDNASDKSNRISSPLDVPTNPEDNRINGTYSACDSGYSGTDPWNISVSSYCPMSSTRSSFGSVYSDQEVSSLRKLSIDSFISTLLTAILTHHLGWVGTVAPLSMPLASSEDADAVKSEERAKMSEISKRHPYNALWAQLGDLFGAIGSPPKISKTIVSGNCTHVVDKVLNVLTYFIRCGEIQRDMREPTKVKTTVDGVMENLECHTVSARELDGDRDEGAWRRFEMLRELGRSESLRSVVENKPKGGMSRSVTHVKDLSGLPGGQEAVGAINSHKMQYIERKNVMNDIPNVLVYRDSRFVRQELRIGNHLMDTGIEMNSKFKNDVRTYQVKNSREQIKFMITDSKEYAFAEEKLARVDEIEEQMEVMSVNLGAIRKTSMSFSEIEQGVEIGEDTIEAERRIYRDDKPQGKLTTCKSLSDLITENSFGQSGRLLWGVEPVKENLTIEEIKHRESREKSTTGNVVFVLGDNEELVGLKHSGSVDAIKPPDTQPGAKKKVCNHKYKKHSGVKFNFEQYPQIAKTYMRNKNLDITDANFEKLIKMRDVKLMACEAGTSSMGSLTEDDNECDCCSAGSATFLQTPSNASELEFSSEDNNYNTPPAPGTAPHGGRKSKEKGEKSIQEDAVKVVAIPMPQSLQFSPDTAPMKIAHSGFIPSLMTGISDHYIPDMVLQGTVAPTKDFEGALRADLTLASHCATLEQLPTENVAIVANTEKWCVSVMSSHSPSGLSMGHTENPVVMSPLVASMLETVQAMWRVGASPYQCMSFMESKLQEIFMHSETLAAFLLATDFCSMSSVTKALNLSADDVPLLMSVATVHSPQVAKKCGVSFRHFISTLLTAILTHHLGWVGTVAPLSMPLASSEDADAVKSEERAKMSEISKRHPYNALWAQLGDLFGAIGSPPKISKTIVSGNCTHVVDKVLNVLTYFIRCGEIQRDMREPTKVKTTVDGVMENLECHTVSARELDGDRDEGAWRRFEMLRELGRSESLRSVVENKPKGGMSRSVTHVKDLSGLPGGQEAVGAINSHKMQYIERKNVMNDIPNVLVYRDSRFVRQELRIGNHLMDTGIEMNSKFKNDVRTYQVKNSREQIKFMMTDSKEYAFAEEKLARVDEIEEQMEVMSVNLGAIRKTSMSFSEIEQGVEIGEDTIEAERRIYRDDKPQGKLTTCKSLSDLITENSFGQSGRLLWGVEPVKENLTIEEIKHRESREKSTTGNVVFVLGDNEELVGLKHSGSVDAIKPPDTQPGAKKKVCNHKYKKHSGVKFNFEQYPQIAKTYMRNKNLDITDANFEKLIKMRDVKLMACEAGTSSMGSLTEDDNECDCCSAGSATFLQTPSNASELEFSSEDNNYNTPPAPGTAPHGGRKSKEKGEKSVQEDAVKVVAIPMPQSLQFSPDTAPMKIAHSGFIPSLMTGISDHYIPDMVLQGTVAPTKDFEGALRADLTLASHCATLEQLPTENVAIVANTEKWCVSVMSSHSPSGLSMGHTENPVVTSPLVASMLETVQAMWRVGASPYQCMSFMESKLQEIFMHSETLAAFLLATDFCSMSSVTKALNLSADDVPLLMSVATVHSPQVAKKCGVSFRQ
uniref:UDENN FNIP1/2-type domain-containing protein n=1 Tax=Lutzomyia longipalpis TaxID=7200 RepID=A0A1B0CN31_LUTLO